LSSDSVTVGGPLGGVHNISGPLAGLERRDHSLGELDPGVLERVDLGGPAR
jgi:hypothetical protein